MPVLWKRELTFDHLLLDQKVEELIGIMSLLRAQVVMLKKGGRLFLQKSGMTLHQHPYQPTTEDLHKNGRNFPPNFCIKLGLTICIGMLS